LFVGDKIKQLRGKLTVREFALKVGLSPSYISDLETNKNKNKMPSTKALMKIAEAHNKDLSYFFGSDDNILVDMRDYKDKAPRIVKDFLEMKDAPAFASLMIDLHKKGITPEEVAAVFSAMEKQILKKRNDSVD